MMSFACAPGDVDATSEAASTQAAPTLECPSLGTNETTFLASGDGSVTVTVEGASTQKGTVVTDAAAAAAGFTAYGNWSQAEGFLKDSVLWVNGSTIQMHQNNVGPFWPSTCKPASAADLSADHCAPLVSELGFVDTTKASTIATHGDDYVVTYPNGAVGDFVWSIPAKRDGLLCTVGEATAVSCAAIVADAIATQARNDGSSSGLPYVSSHSAAKGYVGGVHDEESGEFSYVVKTDSTDDGCKVTSIVSTGDN